jgi:L-Ala-D/L-Glu epimerase
MSSFAARERVEPRSSEAAMGARLTVEVEAFPIAGRFVIARGAKTQAIVATVTLRRGSAIGRGECTPYSRYGETVEGVVAAIEGVREAIEAGANRDALQRWLPAGAARNAIDCAMWDLETKSGAAAPWRRAGLPALAPLTTAFTLSIGAPEEMFAAARSAAHRPLLKIKLAGDGVAARLAAVRAGAPEARLIVDANEAWGEKNLLGHLRACADAGVSLIEQPLPAGEDEMLRKIDHFTPICADESAHQRADLAALRDRYDAVNIKLDKTGGLTEALAMAEEAKALGFAIMAGCMVGTSLAMAPASLIGQMADYVDLDGPLLLARDREPGLRYEGSTMYPPEPDLWG